MKYLEEYTEVAKSKLFKDCNSFFAFNDGQFQEQKKEGIEYVSMGAGLICDKEKVQDLINGLDKIQQEGIAQDIKENGIEGIISRELYNHECFYTGDIEPALGVLKQYKIPSDKIAEVYQKILKQQ